MVELKCPYCNVIGNYCGEKRMFSQITGQTKPLPRYQCDNCGKSFSFALGLYTVGNKTSDNFNMLIFDLTEVENNLKKADNIFSTQIEFYNRQMNLGNSATYESFMSSNVSKLKDYYTLKIKELNDIKLK